jgi:hypothetical protein
MNPNNYGTQPACQRLHDVGIVLETDFYWCRDDDGWYLRYTLEYHREVFESIPAPSMAEVWRELEVDGMCYRQCDILMTAVWTDESRVYENPNPTDALIDLLIWLTAQKEGVCK